MPKTLASVIRKREEAASSPPSIPTPTPIPIPTPKAFTLPTPKPTSAANANANASTTGVSTAKKGKKERMPVVATSGGMSLDAILSLQQQTAGEQLVGHYGHHQPVIDQIGHS